MWIEKRFWLTGNRNLLRSASLWRLVPFLEPKAKVGMEQVAGGRASDTRRRQCREGCPSG